MIKNTLGLCLVALVLAACTSAPLHNMTGVAVPEKANGEGLTLNQVKASVMRGCVGKGWTPRFEEPGLIHCSITVRTHSAEVAIPFTASEYDIRYVDSVNLDDDGQGHIHRNYNNWVNNLSGSIQQELLRQAYDL